MSDTKSTPETPDRVMDAWDDLLTVVADALTDTGRYQHAEIAKRWEDAGDIADAVWRWATERGIDLTESEDQT